MKTTVRYDHVGYWTKVKLDIVKKYAAAYSRILGNQKLYHIYVDAFAGAGKHIDRGTGEFILGSPANALLVSPAFKEYHLIDLDEGKVKALSDLRAGRNDVFLYHGDCNELLLSKIFPRARYEDYRRALCILDPYGLHLDWQVIKTAGKMRSIDIFLNFPVADMNRNVLWRDPEKAPIPQLSRMNRFWGDESWREAAYALSSQLQLFDKPDLEKQSNDAIAEAFRDRLTKVAGFPHVPKPMAMRNSQNAIVYYLFFASQKPVAQEIVEWIFNKYRK